MTKRYRSNWDLPEDEPTPAPEAAPPPVTRSVAPLPPPIPSPLEPMAPGAPTLPMTFTMLLDAERATRGMSQRDFAKFCGISFVGLQRMVGAGSARLDTLFLMGEPLGWTISITDARGWKHTLRRA